MNDQIKKEQQASVDINDIQLKLLTERRTRITVMLLLLSALIFTIIYGTLHNPFQYTFSKIGNRFDPALRIVFIVWAMYTGFAIQASILALFRLENYNNKLHYAYIIVGVIFLVLTAMAPSLDHMPIWITIHLITAFIFAILLTLGFLPFMRWVAVENIRLRRTVYTWLSVIWGGSIACYLILGNTGVFEIFFFTTFIIFLLYITLSLFEEQIIKRSVYLLRDIEDLNRGIDDIFFPEFLRKKSKELKAKKQKKKEKH